MTDDMTSHDQTTDSQPATDETFAWSAEPGSTSGGAMNQGREWLAQLQSMIEQLTTQAAPVVREVGAKAAELAAIAGDKAGPVAQRAAELTGQAGQKLAERSRDLAAELRRDAGMSGEIEGSTDASSIAGDPIASDEPTTPAGVH